jgi:hypothetical protein
MLPEVCNFGSDLFFFPSLQKEPKRSRLIFFFYGFIHKIFIRRSLRTLRSLAAPSPADADCYRHQHRENFPEARTKNKIGRVLVTYNCSLKAPLLVLRRGGTQCRGGFTGILFI